MARPGLTMHRKFRRLAATLGSRIVARGALELLWEPCYESGEDYLGTSDDIESTVGWSGDRGVLTTAFVTAGAPEGIGFIEPVTESTDPMKTTYRVHDLYDHAPDYVHRRLERELDRRRKGETISTLRSKAGKRSGKVRRQRKHASAKDAAKSQARRALSTEQLTNKREQVVESTRTNVSTPAPAPAPAPKDQDQTQDQNPRAVARSARASSEFTRLVDVRSHVKAAIHMALDADPAAGDGVLRHVGKDACGALKAADYSARPIQQFVDAVRAERERRRRA